MGGFAGGGEERVELRPHSVEVARGEAVHAREAAAQGFRQFAFAERGKKRPVQGQHLRTVRVAELDLVREAPHGRRVELIATVGGADAEAPAPFQRGEELVH